MYSWRSSSQSGKSGSKLRAVEPIEGSQGGVKELSKLLLETLVLTWGHCDNLALAYKISLTSHVKKSVSNHSLEARESSVPVVGKPEACPCSCARSAAASITNCF
jgi:hypothetical protein